MQRIVLGIEYDGANYNGWQRQRHSNTVQAELEQALTKIANHSVKTYCAGRTDAGVHACGQIIHFDTTAQRAHIAWTRGVNSYLPKDIRVLFAKHTTGAFDARKSALSRRYCYVIINRDVSPGILSQGASWVLSPLDETLMDQAAQILVGTHDFSSFRAAQCQAKSPVRTLERIKVVRHQDRIHIDVTANAFLHHMVRNITGTLIAIGQQKYPVDFMAKVLNARDRRQALMTAPPNGLYLINVRYPDYFDMPNNCNFPWFIA